MTVVVRPITPEQTLSVRHQVLWPHKPLDFCRVDDDHTGHHFGAFIDDKLVCVASLFIDGAEARLRKFATLPDFQGQGIGSLVLGHLLEQLTTCRDFTQVEFFWCDARLSAVAFYQRFAMQSYGEPFYKADVPYIRMRCTIQPR